MRKDVKLGLAVGGILVAVLVVYVLVVPGSEQPGAELATAESGVESVAGDSSAAGATSTEEPAAPPSVASGTSREQTTAEGQTNEAAPGGDATASNQNGQQAGFDWDKLLNGEASTELPSMSAQTPVAMPQNAGVAAPTVPAGPTATPAQPPMIDSQPAVVDAQPTQPQPAGPIAPPATTDGAPGAPAAPTRTYVVKPNETLSSIAAAEYGSANFYPHIQRANPDLDPTRLKPGTKINLPDASAVKPTAAAAVKNDAPIDPNHEYRVQPNDNLHVISIKLYGKSDRATKIYELNKATIGADPAKVKPGMVLKLPENPTVTASR